MSSIEHRTQSAPSAPAMGELDEKHRIDDDTEVALPVPPGKEATVVPAFEKTVVSNEEPYGWVVCLSMHLINGFTWGIVAVGLCPIPTPKSGS
jgi:hypothetical protein